MAHIGEGREAASRLINDKMKMESLLELWKERIVAKLEKQAIDSIRPQIKAACLQAVSELEADIKGHYNIAADQFALALCVNNKGILEKVKP